MPCSGDEAHVCSTTPSGTFVFSRWRQLGQGDLTRWSWTGLGREYTEWRHFTNLPNDQASGLMNQDIHVPSTSRCPPHNIQYFVDDIVTWMIWGRLGARLSYVHLPRRGARIRTVNMALVGREPRRAGLQKGAPSI